MLGLGILRAQFDTPDAIIRARFYEDLSAGAEQKEFQAFALRGLGDVAFGDDASCVVAINLSKLLTEVSPFGFAMLPAIRV